MKKNKINARNFLLTLMVLAGFVTSCEKEEIETNQNNPGRITVTEANADRGGEDEEYPVVRGIVENGNHVAIAGALVEIVKVGDSTPTDQETTDANGEFEMIVPAGSYFFKVTVSGVTTTTNSINITTSINVVITI